jgi:ectoine hydroxylase-related dioxygenase (phytanoyl-CoA dioxygenase family)
MDAIEKYEFDRQGFLVIPDMLSSEQAAQLARAIDTLEDHALKYVRQPPRKRSIWNIEYHANPEKGYHTNGGSGHGETLLIEDFFNADPAFDLLVDHPRTMSYIREIVQGAIRVNNSEIRIRYPGNATGVHMGGPIDHKYRYAFNARGIDCMMVRMIYFVHDVDEDQGPFCVVPGTHKSNYSSPYNGNPDEEPGMVALPVKAGDAILFTENLRHGGLTNRSEQTRKTLHVGYGPAWMMSQNISTMDEPQFITPATLARYTSEQRKLFVLEPSA